MKTYEVTLTKTIKVRVEAESTEEARKLAVKFDDEGEYDLDWEMEMGDDTIVTNLDETWKESWDDIITAGTNQVVTYEERKEQLHNRKIYNTLEELRADNHPEELG